MKKTYMGTFNEIFKIDDVDDSIAFAYIIYKDGPWEHPSESEVAKIIKAEEGKEWVWDIGPILALPDKMSILIEKIGKEDNGTLCIEGHTDELYIVDNRIKDHSVSDLEESGILLTPENYQLAVSKKEFNALYKLIEEGETQIPPAAPTRPYDEAEIEKIQEALRLLKGGVPKASFQKACAAEGYTPKQIGRIQESLKRHRQ